MKTLMIAGREVTDDDLIFCIDIIEAYGDLVEKYEPHATRTIDAMRSVASALPQDVETWLGEYQL